MPVPVLMLCMQTAPQRACTLSHRLLDKSTILSNTVLCPKAMSVGWDFVSCKLHPHQEMYVPTKRLWMMGNLVSKGNPDSLGSGFMFHLMRHNALSKLCQNVLNDSKAKSQWGFVYSQHSPFAVMRFALVSLSTLYFKFWLFISGLLLSF